MSTKQISELETVLQQSIAEHRKLLGYMGMHQAAMKKFDLKVMDDSARQQEACRLRIIGLEQRRQIVVGQIAQLMKLGPDVTLRKIASLYPARAEALLKLRTDLKTAAEEVRSRAFISGRVANAVLGHLNTAVRLFAGAVGKAGLYNKNGVPKIANRIGVMEAVG